jgi:RNA polymerase sigma factor (sigma-70 family)
LARRQWLDWLRRRRKESAVSPREEEAEEAPEDPPVTDPLEIPHEAAEIREGARTIRQALENLPPLRRTIVLEHSVKGVSFRDLGLKLRMPHTTVRYQYLEAIKQLRPGLEGQV